MGILADFPLAFGTRASGILELDGQIFLNPSILIIRIDVDLYRQSPSSAFLEVGSEALSGEDFHYGCTS